MVSGGHSLNFDQENREVCGFVLSQVVKMIRKYEEMERSKLTSINDSRILNRIVLLKEIRTFEEDIVDDEFYVKNCYSELDQILIRGRLSLISPHYYNFVIELMNVIRSNTTEKLLLQRKNDFIKDGKRIILENQWVKRLI